MKRKTIIARRERRKANYEGKGSRYAHKKQRQAKGKFSKNSPFKVQED